MSCGGGIRTRDVSCVRSDFDEVVPESLCGDTAPVPLESCNDEVCPLGMNIFGFYVEDYLNQCVELDQGYSIQWWY